MMQQMADGEVRLLVCTTIIETGIGIPNVNTLIIGRRRPAGSGAAADPGPSGRSLPPSRYAYSPTAPARYWRSGQQAAVRHPRNM